MKKLLLIVASFVFLFAMSSFVIAAEDDTSNQIPYGDDALVVSNGDGAESVISAANKTKEQKNMTYGICVSEAAKIKNKCYASLKEVKISCKANTATSADKKASLKTCFSDAKTIKANCKKDFKSVKQECKKIKHNFLETIRYSLA